jgi:hypothetical protein
MGPESYFPATYVKETATPPPSDTILYLLQDLDILKL